MWIFQNNSFVSVVENRNDKNTLLVRSRIKGDIQKAVPGAKVFEDLNADYRYRALVTRDEFKSAMCDAVDRIDYPNFKNSIATTDHRRHSAYSNVWSVMAERFGAWVGKRRVTNMVLAAAMQEPDEDKRLFLYE